jgi:hypothetical protein
MNIEITTDCMCEGYRHEITNYPRPGLFERKFKTGDVFAVEKEWSNMFGGYYKIRLDDGYGADIALNNATLITEDRSNNV